MTSAARDLNATLASVLVEIQRDETSRDRIRSQIDTALLCKVVKILVPNIQQKIDEYIVAKELGLQVSQKSTGADLIDASNQRNYEVKVSVVTARHPKCNFMWNLPVQDTPDRSVLLAQVRAKTSGGGAIFIVRDGLGRDTARFEFSTAFLEAYFRQVPYTMGKTTSYNFGCAQCRVCRGFHRLDRFMDYDRRLGTLTESDWRDLFQTKTRAQCSGDKKVRTASNVKKKKA